MSYRLLLCIILCSASVRGLAQIDSSSVKLVGFPVAYSSPETGFAFGAFGILSFEADAQDTLTPASAVQLGIVYTTEEQLLFYLPFEVYSKKRNWTLRGELGYYIYSYLFFGVGDETKVGGELYELTYPRVRADVLKRVDERLFLGAQYLFDDLNITSVEEGGLLDAGNVAGGDGGIISGVGPLFEFDGRDNVYSTRRGSFVSMRAAYYDKVIGSDFGFRNFSFDARHFWTFGKSVVGAQVNYEVNSRDVPFTSMGLVGGARTMRGYYRGRYRDRNLWLTQAEWRHPIKGKFTGAVFGGVAETYDDVLDLKNLRYAAGAGVRFMLIPERRINLRFDYALGEAENSGFYFTIGEAF